MAINKENFKHHWMAISKGKSKHNGITLTEEPYYVN